MKSIASKIKYGELFYRFIYLEIKIITVAEYSFEGQSNESFAFKVFIRTFVSQDLIFKIIKCTFV